MLDGVWQRTATYHLQEDCVIFTNQGSHREVGLCTFAELERDARMSASLVHRQLEDITPWIEDTAIHVSSRRTDKRNPHGQLSVQVECLLVVDFVVRGLKSLVPVRWQYAGKDYLANLKHNCDKVIREEIVAAHFGTSLNKPLYCPVILDTWLSSQLIHECIGHTSEADNFIQYVRPAGIDLDYKWCEYPINIYDNPCLPDQRVTYDYDDDGEPARCSKIITDGRWTDLLVDADHSKKLSMPAGHGRRTPYSRYCLPRMSNTYLEAGKERVEELIATVDYGILCIGTWGGGSSHLEFIIRPAYGHWIFNGYLTNCFVRRFDLVGNKFNTIAKIAGVSNNVSWFSPVYGCDKFGQNNLPVTMGAPYVLLSHVELQPISSRD